MHKQMVLSVAACLLLSISLAGCTGSLQQTAMPAPSDGENKEVTSGVGTVHTDHPLYAAFQEAYPGLEPIVTGVADFTDDGESDLIVVYPDPVEKRKNKMVAIWKHSGVVEISEPEPAPVEHCLLKWKDIDNKPPIELIISGSKSGQVGYAIYRFENGDFINIFGEGMDACC